MWVPGWAFLFSGTVRGLSCPPCPLACLLTLLEIASRNCEPDFGESAGRKAIRAISYWQAPAWLTGHLRTGRVPRCTVYRRYVCQGSVVVILAKVTKVKYPTVRSVLRSNQDEANVPAADCLLPTA
jgi:hypothetical protein